MNEEKFREIMDEKCGDWDGDNAFLGLKIITSYLPKEGICGADHDIIYSSDIDGLIEAGITEDDVRELGRLNWMIQDDYLACYV